MITHTYYTISRLLEGGRVCPQGLKKARNFFSVTDTCAFDASTF